MKLAVGDSETENSASFQRKTLLNFITFGRDSFVEEPSEIELFTLLWSLGIHQRGYWAPITEPVHLNRLQQRYGLGCRPGRLIGGHFGRILGKS